MSIECRKGKLVARGWETVLTRIWGRLGTGKRHSHEEIEENEVGLEVKVFA
jgi:hypothetical protein